METVMFWMLRSVGRVHSVMGCVGQFADSCVRGLMWRC